MYTTKDLLESLIYPLPEDIRKAKDNGDFQKTLRLIERYCTDENTPVFIKKRLTIEKEIVTRLPANYPYSFDEGLALVKQEIPDFTSEELQEAMDTKKADWIYIDGKVHLQKRFFASMKKVYKDIADRAKSKENTSHLLDETIDEMATKGSLSYTHTIRTTLTIKDEYFQPGKVLVHLPLPVACDTISNIEILQTSHPHHVSTNKLSHTISFSPTLETNEPFSVTYRFTTKADYIDLPVKDTYVDITTDLNEQYPQIVFTPAVKELAHTLTKGEDNLLVKAWRLYEFCSTKITYAFMRDYITLGNINEYALAQRIGDCGVKALLFITMCRYIGIPAHWQSGLYVTSEYVGNHDWAMFYIAPFGWLYADPSFGGSAKMQGNDTRYHHYFGRLDPFRMVANNDFQQEFDPPKKYLRNDPYDNQSGEAEYPDHGLNKPMYDTVHTLLSSNKNK